MRLRLGLPSQQGAVGRCLPRRKTVNDKVPADQRDANWKKMATTYRKKAQKETQDEKDEELMISNFQENLKAAKELLLTQADLLP